MNMRRTIAFAATASVAVSLLAVDDAIRAPELGNVRLLGRSGDSADACIDSRARSAWARGAMYEECVNAFRTHWDDSNGRSGWQNEYWGKTMLCYAGAAAYTHDAGIADWIVSSTHDFLREFQKPNGYLSTYANEDLLRRDPKNPDAKQHWCFNIWGRKYTFWGLIDIYRATGDKEALDGAVKMADHLVAQLKRLNVTIDRTGSWNGVSSMSILRPLLELYRIVPKQEYLDLAKDIVRAMDAEPATPASLLRNAFRKEKIYTWFPEPGFWAKAYETLSLLEGLVDYYRLTGDSHVLDGVLAFYGHIEREEINPMCSAGHFDHLWGGGERLNGMTELCDVTHWIRLNRELLLVTGEAKYADRLEEAFFNAFLAGVTRDGRWGAHIVRSHGTRHLWAPPQTGMFHHQCCPDNMMRTYFDVATCTAGLAADGSIAVAWYADADTTLPGARVITAGGYPWGDAPVTVTIERKDAGKVRFRVPAWSKSLKLNGKDAVAEKGWCTVDAPAGRSAWTLAFDLSPRVIEAPTWGEDVPSTPARHSVTDVKAYTAYFMEWCCPEMHGLCRTRGAVRVMRGPLVLAKGRLAGTPREHTFANLTHENGGQGWNVELRALPPSAANCAVPRAWRLTMSRGAEEGSFVVSDFASVSNVDDPSNWFSLWF